MRKSSKQKLNTKRSTEAELVGASDYLPFSIWGKKFLEAQGYKFKESTYFKDNESTIHFEKSRSKERSFSNTYHILHFVLQSFDLE
mmetsp:Transcript_8589/g.11350  ORF Transcript_8589/g.11350 Transcript_8589/m.11350 type:complete len:86 (-) Transcript_8589:179-436(-)